MLGHSLMVEEGQGRPNVAVRGVLALEQYPL